MNDTPERDQPPEPPQPEPSTAENSSSNSLPNSSEPGAMPAVPIAAANAAAAAAEVSRTPFDPAPQKPSNDASAHDGGGNLTLHILLGISLAVAFAIIAGVWATYSPTGRALPSDNPGLFLFLEVLNVGGEIFLRVLKMVVVPLVIASVMSGIINTGDIRRLGRPGAYTLLYFLITTFIAVIVGQVLVNVIEPGQSISKEQVVKAKAEGAANKSIQQKTAKEVTPADAIKTIVLMMFTDNVFQALLNGDLLPLIFFSIVFAGMLTTLGDKVRPITDLVRAGNEALLTFVLMLMRFAPLGIFCLVASRFGQAQLQGDFLNELRQIFWYFLTVVLALFFYTVTVYPASLWLFTKRNPWVFLVQMRDSLLMAFSTASSSASLPLTLEVAIDKVGIKKEAVEFVLPIGATVNQNGTALYEAVAAIFIAQAAAQVTGVQLGLGEQMIIAVTATLAAFGAAGIPEAGLVTLLIVLNAVHLDTQMLPLILSVDWLLDRFRTTVNVLGDVVGAAVVENSFPEPEPAE